MHGGSAVPQVLSPQTQTLKLQVLLPVHHSATAAVVAVESVTPHDAPYVASRIRIIGSPDLRALLIGFSMSFSSSVLSPNVSREERI